MYTLHNFHQKITFCKTIVQNHNQETGTDTVRIQNISITLRVPRDALLQSHSIILDPWQPGIYFPFYNLVILRVLLNGVTVRNLLTLTLFFTYSACHWRFTQVVAHINSAFLFIAEYYTAVGAYQSLFNSSPAEGLICQFGLLWIKMQKL